MSETERFVGTMERVLDGECVDPNCTSHEDYWVDDFNIVDWLYDHKGEMVVITKIPGKLIITLKEE